jgi:hypothetical protein
MRKFLGVFLLSLVGCDTPSSAIVDNAFPDTYTVERVWWQVNYFGTPVAPGESSESERTVPGTAIVWAILGSATNPNMAVRSPGEVKLAERGDTLHLVMSAETLTGICGVNSPLSADDAAHAILIFPDELAGTYDPATCTYSGLPDAGTPDAGL